MSSRTSPRANSSDFPAAGAPGLFQALRAALRGWAWGSAPAEPAARDEPVLPITPDPDLHYLRRIAGSAGRWKRQLAEAKAVWPRASVADLVATDGHVQKLAALLQERYQISHAEAEAEVLSFFAARSP
ncbi:hypothetical protein [Arenimonas sp.]|uniref:CsbD family protein n=1 Tax=Arenimonas sp. TaxID=1872635 RepID=UPI0025BF2BF8|nr:hypothetical protein [Arenimonas sp.]